MGTMLVPVVGVPRTWAEGDHGATGTVPSGDKKALADVALNTARAKGASYADVRIGRYLNQFVATREHRVQNLVDTESFGVGVRVLANGTWGFAATSDVSKDAIARAATNVSLEPGTKPLSAEKLIGDVEKGIYIAGRGSYSIDQQRYNFQFGGQVFFEIKDGKIAGMLRDVAYQSNTQAFWNSCVTVCDAGDYRLFGTFFDGKGQPSQASAVSHGSSTARFNGINVINTERKSG